MFVPAYATSISTNNDHDEVTAYLHKQAEIRVLTDGTPAFGNITASINLMNQLRVLGFDGVYTFIYPKSKYLKIIKLFNFPDKIGDDFFDDKNKIHFMTLNVYIDQYRQSQIKHLPLAITGGFEYYDSRGIDLQLETENIKPEILDKKLRVNLANFLNADTFLHLAPYLDTQGDTYLWQYQSDGQIKQTKLKDSHKQFIVVPVASFAESKNYLFNNNNGQRYVKEHPAIISLFNRIANQSINFIPAYGFSLQFDKLTCDDERVANMLEILAGARYAQLYGEKTLQKPLVIGVFYDYRAEISALNELIRQGDWSQYACTGSEQAKQTLQKLNLVSAFVTADLSQKDAINVINTLNTNQVLLLSMGAMPKIVFDGLYNHGANNVLAPIREGANSFNSLILNGRPHIRCSDVESGDNPWEIGYDLAKPAVRNYLQSFYRIVCRDISPWQDNDMAQLVGNFIIDANNQQSELSHYFHDLQQAALNPQNDRIYSAVKKAIHVAEKVNNR